MITSKKINAICIAVAVFAVILTILFMNGESFGIQAVADGDDEVTSDSEYFTANDINSSWSTETATHVTLNGDGGNVTGSGAYFLGNDLHIIQSGYYVISGKLEDGSIVVDAASKSRIWIMLNGVDVRSSDDAAFRIDQAKKVFVTLAEGTENTFTDGTALSEEAAADKTNACIFAHDNLTINGSGSLTINGNYKNGITAKDNLVIAGGNITVNSKGDGIRANEKLKIRDAVINIEAADDGLVVDHPDGYLYMLSGTVSILSFDDAVSSAGDAVFDGGKLTINALNDGIHSDTGVYINGCTMLINECYEGIEALTITMTGGDVTIYPEDDGFNANGGSGDGFGGFGGPGSDASNTASGEENENASSSASDSFIKISGGSITIVNTKGADCDGLDSNGSIYIFGGDIRVSLPGSGGPNSAIDYGSENGGVCVITGGTVIACGSYTMAESFDESSTQCSILYNFSNGAAAGSILSVEDKSGNTLLSYEVPNSFTSANISCPKMQLGETYLVVIGDNAEEITLDSVSSSYGDAQSSMFGGNMNWGGMSPRGNFGSEGNVNDSGDRPTPPDGSGFPGGTSENGDTGLSEGWSPRTSNTDTVREEAEEEVNRPLSLAMFGASGAVMLLGLAFAFAYKRKEF